MMERTNGIVRESTGIVEAPGNRSDQAGNIIDLIGKVPGRKSLLAPDVAIEVARAGKGPVGGCRCCKRSVKTRGKRMMR